MKKIITTSFLALLCSGSLLAQGPFYLKATGSITTLTSWGINTDGSGTNPTSFTSANTVWNIRNRAPFVLNVIFTVAPTATVNIGDGSTAITLSVTSGAGGIKSAANPPPLINLNANATFVVTTPGYTTQTNFTNFSCNANSTFQYNSLSSATTVQSITYGNLTISKSCVIVPNGNITVNGTLALNSGATLNMTQSAALTTYGNITGTGNLDANSTSQLYLLGGSGSSIGTVNFAAGGNTLGMFDVQFNTAATSVTLGSSIFINDGGTGSGSNLLQNMGGINLNGNSITCDSSCTVALPSDNVSGVITGSSTSKLIFNGPVAGGNVSGNLCMDQTSNTTKMLSTLILNSTGSTLSVVDPLNITDSICPTAGTIDASGTTLTLIADQTTVGRTGRIGVVSGTFNIGTFISQVYHSPNTNNTDWRLIGVAGASGVPFSQWNAASTGGTGVIPMSCPTCPYTTVSGQAFSSITTYDEPTGNYPDITYGSNIAVGTGYWVYMGTTSPSTASAPLLISVTGTPVMGNVSVPLTSSGSGADQGYNLVANPYASTISFTKLRALNPAINNSWFTYSPAIGDNAGYAGGISTPGYSHGGSGIDDIIPAGMGFFANTSVATTLVFQESVKATGNNEVLLRTANTNTVPMTYFRMQVTNPSTNIMNESVVRLEANATTGFDPNYDLPDMTSRTPGLLQIGTSSLGDWYTINSLPNNQSSYSIPVRITCGTTGSYQFNTADMQRMPSGACIMLHDNYTNTNYDLRAGSFNLTINDTEKVARFTLNININNNLTIASSNQAPTCPKASNGFIIANVQGSGTYNYYWKDSASTIIKTTLNRTGADTLSNIKAGNYQVEASINGTCSNASQNITIQALNYVTSAFVPSSVRDSLIGDTAATITFTNNSAYATQYLWDFGDGQNSSLVNPPHTYTYRGIFNVKLYAINASCNDTAMYSKYVRIDTLKVKSSATGIASLQSNNNMRISRDNQGYYVQFDYQNAVDATISVQNLLGQKVVGDVFQRQVTTEKAYINLGNSDNNVLIIYVTNSRGERIYQKIINL
ncbi:MAG: PKD domain-containing protein [Bacteroidetes bacterium]|nr:PKD domain-containing protein [Bacteroidota bacterium]